jgi:hypothetical protein
VFFILLFANLAFLAWAHWIDVPQPAPPNEAIERLPRLKLVSEQRASGAARPMPTQSREGSVAGVLATHAEERPSPARQCFSVGPFNDITHTARVAAVLRQKGFEPQQRAGEGETLEGYWVYVGGIESDADSRRVLHELERSGMKDAHAMPDMGEGLRVSVGLFSERERADRRAQAVRKLGLDAQVTERRLAGTVYWVDVSVPQGADAPLPTRDITSVAAKATRIEVQPCPSEPGGAGSSPADPLAPPDRGPTGTIPATTVAGSPKLP